MFLSHSSVESAGIETSNPEQRTDIFHVVQGEDQYPADAREEEDASECTRRLSRGGGGVQVLFARAQNHDQETC